ncbi:MAG: PilZ domain-containing protein, partial [Candidatus Aminicenantes bacterium]|nr:PilZ domain-containing protein [Candidatus Aminicenantes bacterium]
MTNTSSSKKTPKKIAIKEKSQSNTKFNRREEWRFELPLSVLVEGKISRGKKFKEETILQNISSGGAYFCLDSGVTVGSKLNLVIEVPDKLTEGKKVKLSLGGLTVRLEKPTQKGKKQGIALRFSKKFEFIT